MWFSFYLKAQLDSIGLQPVIDYLAMIKLPEIPSILANATVDMKSKIDFDWVQSVALIKKLFGADVLIGFDIFPDPTNRSANRIVLGTPESGSILPL